MRFYKGWLGEGPLTVCESPEFPGLARSDNSAASNGRDGDDDGGDGHPSYGLAKIN